MKIIKNIFIDIPAFFSKNSFTGDVNVTKDALAIKESIKNIILTVFNERPFDPEFGTNVTTGLFENPTDFSFYIENTISSALERYEPRIKLTGIKTSFENRTLNIDVEYKLINPNTASSDDYNVSGSLSIGVYVPRKIPETLNYNIDLDHEKRMFGLIPIGAIGQNTDWTGWTDTIISTYQGNPDVGTRAYAWEADPSFPNVSSPWHNIIYENIIDIYRWGGRAFHLNCPFGGFDYTFFLTQEIRKRTLLTVVDDKKNCPARWKGFKEAVRSLIEGNLAPSGKLPINEPCNVMIYHPTNRGYYVYRNLSNALWDSLGATTEQRDLGYYEYLNSWVADLIDMKGRTTNSAKLIITMDATSPSATPETLHLYRTMPDYRSDALELADWYVFNKLRDNGIEVFYESRTEKIINQANVPLIGTGTVGSASNVGWAKNGFAAEEYWLWFSDPSSDDVIYDNHVSNAETQAIFRYPLANFPVPASTNKDPYGTIVTVKFNSTTKTLVNPSPALSYIFSPHFDVWSIYILSDNYRKYYNLKNNTNTFSGVLVNTPNYVSYFPERYTNQSYCIANYSSADPKMNYRRISASNAQLRPLFDSASFLANPSAYNSGFWTTSGINYWDTNVKTNSFSNFLTFLHNYSLVLAPKSATDWAGATYGSSSDYLANNTIVLV